MNEKPTSDQLLQDTLISLVTFPTLVLLLITRSATATMITAGRWSEELLRGDRLPHFQDQFPDQLPDQFPDQLQTHPSDLHPKKE